jgi:mutant ntrC-like activator (fragment)
LIESWNNQVPELLCVGIYSNQDNQTGFHACKLGSQEIYEIERGSINELDKILQQYKIFARRPQRYRHKSEEYNKAVRDLTNLVNHGKPVLITGESGTGKSYLSEHVHRNGTDGDFRLEEISCAELDVENGMEILLGVIRNFRPQIKHTRKGLLHRANEKGLIYLKDIQLLPSNLQEALVEVLERGTFRSVGDDTSVSFTAHFIASCNDISQIYNEGFNRRLYELLSHNMVKLPPLRGCQADIIPNSVQMIEDYCISKGIADIPSLERSAIIKISAHNWPGNYRELKSCIENAVICCEGRKIRDCDLNITNGDRLPEDEKGQLIFFLTKHKGKKVLVMKDMGITAPTLDKKLKHHCIDYKIFKPVKVCKTKK